MKTPFVNNTCVFHGLSMLQSFHLKHEDYPWYLLSSLAFKTAVCVILSPPSILASSITEPSLSSSFMDVTVLLSLIFFTIPKCFFAIAAICGRCVIHITCRQEAILSSLFATIWAVLPLIPVSISSKISVSISS